MEDEKFAKKLEAAINKEMREKNPVRGYQHQHGKKAQEAFNQHFKLEKKEPLKPETFQANGKKYVNTTGLTMKSRYDLIVTRTKSKYEVERVFRKWERDQQRRKKKNDRIS